MSSRSVAHAVLMLLVAATVASIAVCDAAQAKSRGGVHGFRTGTCKTSSCRAKHPSGHCVHPLTRAKHHR